MGLLQNIPDVFSFLLILTLSLASSGATQLEILNNCTYTVWAAANPGGGKLLNQGETWTLNNISGSGRIWGRTKCVFGPDGRGKCESGDCDGRLECQVNGRAPNTLAEYSIDRNNAHDDFCVSVVEGFNIPTEFSPAASSLSSSECIQESKCAGDVNGACPMELRDPGGCNNPCTVFGNNQFCCTSGNICEPTSYSKFFKDLCPDAFTFPYEFGQRSTCPTGTDYKVVFCPKIASHSATRKTGVPSATFTIKNNCSYTIWPGTLTGAGKPQLSSTGFELGPGAMRTLDVPTGWSGQLWARTGCFTSGATGKLSCATADCGSGLVECDGASGIPPASLVELTLGADGGQDFYDVSLVDGFNLPVALAPQGGFGACQSTSCPTNVNGVCPPELAVNGADGRVIACKSACLAFNQPQYCCSGDFNTLDKCPPTNYSRIFKKKCPQAYSYAYDDKSSSFTCSGGADYAITFCP